MDEVDIDLLADEKLRKMDTKAPLTKAQEAQLDALKEKVFKDRMTPQEAMGISSEMMEYLYRYGYNMYQNGNYKVAKNIFLFLVGHAARNSRNILALAASYQRVKDYDKATEAYYTYGCLETDDPMPFYYMYDCYMKSDLPNDADFCLKEAIQRCGNVKKWVKIKERSELLLKALQEELSEEEVLAKMDKPMQGARVA